MILGKNISDLRRINNITQDALAAELGVTAAAVSKWENGYTLPDILMLCALADYFNVTTDFLLGRCQKKSYAVIAASSEALGERITSLIRKYGIIAKAVCCNQLDASEIIRADTEITYLICGILGSSFPEIALDLGERKINLYLSISDTEQGILNDLENALGNGS